MDKNNKEVRCYGAEMRAEPESRKVEGYALVFDKETRLGWFTEKIDRNALDGADMADVRALFNHDANIVLARTVSKTLTLEVDDKGLKYSFDMPNTTAGNDLLELIRRGDVSQSSFAFTVKEQQWIERSGEEDMRVITKIDALYDVSPVTYPAYADTTVAARSKEAAQNETKPKKEEKQELNDLADGIEFLNSRKAKNK
jgi:HK97 family phage prohead protease